MRYRSLRPSAGQAMLEMAILLPAMLLITVGTMEAFRAFNVKHVVTDAAREGARQAVVQDPSIDADSVGATIALALVRASVEPATATITFDSVPPPGGHWRETGALQTVSISVPFRFSYLGGLVKLATGSETIPINARISMRNE